jgi:hypothetical protein
MAFLEHLSKKFPKVYLHRICDNYGTTNTSRVKVWIAERPRFTLHFTPTSASWRNLVECWFARITRGHPSRWFRQRSPTGAGDQSLPQKMEQRPQPFRWTKSARTISRKIAHANVSMGQNTN